MIQITCKGNSASCTRRKRLTSGMVGLQCEFVFDGAWDGLARTAVFWAGNEKRDVLLTGDTCTVPWEVLKTAGYQLVIGVYGTNAEGTLVIPTVYAMCGGIASGADPSGDESTDPTLPVWGQMQGMIGDLGNLATSSKDNLVAAINEAAQSGGGGSGVQPDWNQNDVSAPDYVKNRTHWEEVEEVEILAETTVTISEDVGDKLLPNTTQLTVGQTYFVILDGVSYECVAWYSDSEGAVIIGNGAICGGEGGNGEPFSCDSYSDGKIYLNTEKAGTYTISISTMENVVHRLDKKYLPDEVIKSIGIANNAQTTANNAQTTANNAQTTANNAQTTANSKMNSNNPVGTGSFSMGRKTGSAVGTKSHTEGNNTTASGEASHAEGASTTASGYCSHAEGSHTTASGFNSHAEGDGATASGDRSHAEGLSTTASSQDQHVQGKFNVEDSSNKYAHIVGNGTNASARSNAHTLDWNGNVWYAGDVYVGSTSGINKDEGSKKLATEEYVDSKQDTLIQSGASVGQIAKITAVDGSGKPTAWEPVDMPSGGGGEVWRYLGKFETSEDVYSIVVSEDADGNPFALKKVIVSGLIAANNAAFTGWMKIYDQNGTVVFDLPNSVAQNDGGTVVGRGFQCEAWIIAGTYHQRTRLASVNTGVAANNLTTVSGASGAFTYVDKVAAPEAITKLTGKSYSSTPWGAGSYLHVWGVYA